MILEQIVRGIRTIRTVVLASMMQSCTHYAIPTPKLEMERTQREISTILEHIDAGTPLFSMENHFATGYTNLTRADEDDVREYKKLDFALRDGTKIKGLYKEGKRDSALIISSWGFLADSMAQPPHTFMNVVGATKLQEYAILILDHPTSARFYCLNGEASWGGIEEGYILVEVAKEMKERYHPGSIHLLGNSMGGMGVIHAAYRNEGLITSAMVFSAVTDYTDVPGNALRNVTKNSTFGPAVMSDSLNSFGLGLLIDHFEEQVREDTICAKRYSAYSSLEELFMKSRRYQHDSLMSVLLKPYVERGVFTQKKIDSMNDYLQRSDANRIAAGVGTPLFLIHASDDSVVPQHHWYRFMTAAGGNNNVAGMMMTNGGHWGFVGAYGREWVGCMIKVYADYWAGKNLNEDRECFE